MRKALYVRYLLFGATIATIMLVAPIVCVLADDREAESVSLCANKDIRDTMLKVVRRCDEDPQTQIGKFIALLVMRRSVPLKIEYIDFLGAKPIMNRTDVTEYGCDTSIATRFILPPALDGMSLEEITMRALYATNPPRLMKFKIKRINEKNYVVSPLYPYESCQNISLPARLP
jgi:hypothetical protein